MPDIFSWYGEDIAVSPTGDLAQVDGLDRSNQRILRRLFTNLKDYLWHPDYGAGVPERIGQVVDVYAIETAVRTQIMKEAAVAKSPLPTITVQPIENGVFVTIQYLNAETGQQSTLSFDVSQ